MIKAIVKKNAYNDSVTLMLISREVQKLDGVEDVLVGMGTELNLDLVKTMDMFVPELEGISPNDLFIAARYDESKVSMDDIVVAFNEEMNKKKESGSGDYQPPTLSSALNHLRDANMLVLSIPGEYAAE